MIRRILFFSGLAVLSAAGIGVSAFWGLLYLLPYFEPDPMEELRLQTPARIWTDEHGKWLHVRRTYEAQWRFEVELGKISPAAIHTMLAVEDHHFYRHNGVDPAAAFRAFRQNLMHGRIISGASTISMQLAGMTQSGPRRSLKRKIRQILKARRLEQLYSKDRILQEYFNRLPFGGKIYGIEAAALYYFGQHAADLNRSEAALLCGLPQRPNAYRPDRFPAQALKRRDRVLKQMERRQLITAGERHHIRKKEPLRFRAYTISAVFQQLENSPDRMYFDLAAREAGKDQFIIPCAYQGELARLLRQTLTEQCRTLAGVEDAAGVLIENTTGAVIALTGSIASSDTRNSQVNAATAIRSAGSSLKPFLYAEAISGGMITADTVLKDLPVRYGSYAPGNYDGTFRGEVRAGEALADSLNTPAVRLAEELGVERIYVLFRKLHLLQPDHRQEDGLSLVLGTAGHTLLDLTAAYRVFSRKGKWTPPTFLVRPNPQEEIPVFTDGTGQMIARMLKRPMPGTSGSPVFAWKTGTSNGNHDAWCFAFTPEYTLGVWFGNKDGHAAAALVGTEAAAPAAGMIMEWLRHSAGIRKQADFPDTFRYDLLCAKSGLRATPSCQDTFPGYSLRLAPLRPCRSCQRGQLSSIRILNPAPETYISPEEHLILPLRADSRTPPHWFLNGRYLGKFQQKKLPFPAGHHRLRAVSESADETTAEVAFSVLRSL